MPRPRDEERRERLRAGACDYLLRVGVSNANLAELPASSVPAPGC